MDHLEKTMSAKEILDFMRSQGYVWVREDELKTVKLKERIKRKSWITQKEIADSKIWGVDKGAVKVIVKNEVNPEYIDADKPPFKVHKSEVERIALNRGTW